MLIIIVALLISVRIEDADPFTVPYLSPVVLRKELESLLTQGKGSILNSERVSLEKPILYWNAVWYFSRLKLPTYLPLLTLRRIVKSHPQLSEVSINIHDSDDYYNYYRLVC